MEKKFLAAVLLCVISVAAIGLVFESMKDTPERPEGASVGNTGDPANDIADSEETSGGSGQTGSVPAGDGWSTFRSAQGLSFKYPERVWGNCDGADAWVEMKVFDDVESGHVFVSADCAATLDSLRRLAEGEGGIAGYKQEKFFHGWSFALKDVENEQELDGFVKEHYGADCSVKSKEAAEEGVFEIGLGGYEDAEGSPTDLGNAVCPVNYLYKIYYSPEKQKAVSLVLGQEPTFWTDSDYSGAYDQEMTRSVRLD